MDELFQDTDNAITADSTRRVLLTDGETGGVFSLTIMILPPFCPGDPPQRELAYTQGWYVLNGALAVTVGERTEMLKAGSTAWVPPGAEHACWNPTATITTVLLITIQWHGSRTATR